MNEVTIVSLFAASLSMISFLPQAWQIIRSRNTDAVSTRMYLIVVAGFLCWLAYGVLTMQWAIIGQNTICLIVSSFILGMKMLSRGRTAEVAEMLDPSDRG